jgi:UDP-glucose 4-epimerase
VAIIVNLSNSPIGQAVLVTGASGFIARTLVQRLLEKRIQVHMLSRSLPEVGPDQADCEFFQGDINDAALLSKACTGVDTIFHLAGYAHVNQYDTQAMRQVNVEGTRALLVAAVNAGVRRIVFFSSILADETLTPVLTAYGESKRQAEQLLLEAAQNGQIEVCCLRPANVYGLGMKGNLFTMIRLMQRGLMPPLPVPSASLSLIGNRDLCEAALLAAQAPQANGKIYSVTDGKTYTMKGIEVSVRSSLGLGQRHWHTPMPVFFLAFASLEVLGKLLRLPNAPGLRSYRALRSGNVVSSEKIQNELGYNPAGSLTDELPGILQQSRNL